MKKKQNTRRNGQAGFTLIELMIVIAIIAVLAGVVTTNLISAMGKGNTTAAAAQISNFKTALIAYKLEFKKFPTTSEGLNALVNNGKTNFLDATEVPRDPWGNDYIYTSPGSHGSDFDIVSYGKDGTPGGDDENADIESWNLHGK